MPERLRILGLVSRPKGEREIYGYDFAGGWGPNLRLTYVRFWRKADPRVTSVYDPGPLTPPAAWLTTAIKTPDGVSRELRSRLSYFGA